jgi:hypothetical protein
MINKKQEQLLRHMLGADERYKKKNWGFRNHFCSGGPDTDDHTQLEIMADDGLVTGGSRFNSSVFWATKKGAIAIGFKPYQLRGTEFPEEQDAK